MKYRYITIWFSFLLTSFISGYSQQSTWPALVQGSDGASIKVYEPQPESFSGGVMKMRAAISVINSNQQDPVFGVIWADVQMGSGTDNSQLYWKNLSITNIKLPGDISDDQLSQLKSTLENALPAKNLSISQADLNSRLSSARKETELSSNLSTRPPKIIYTKKPSMLVTIDGQPQMQQNPDWNVQQVVNTPFTIIKNDDQQYYLYGEKRWFRSNDATGPWTYIPSLPSSLSKINDAVQANDTSHGNYLDYTVPDVIVSTEPAELIQSNGDANFSPLEGTNLLYMTNSVNDIFLDVNSQQYYVLISGRWYRSVNLNSNWNFVPSSSLPKDFAQIPEGSPKDAVLANVAGTQAASDAIADAQLPQTAKVDRNTATTNVTYDGEPQFENISGTRLRYAVNTPNTVLNMGRDYYSVENGVWFQSGSPYGPWTVATSRPDEVENIPPSYPVYNTKYVDIYDVTPDYVWMGYTPGYLGAYVYGPTVFYGTGYYYRPWRGHYYYPRPITWGYNMRYNPFYGWGFGVNLNFGWLNIGFGNRYSSPFWGCRGGWFGPSVYYPAYYRPFNAYYGPRVNVYAGNYYRVNSYNNIYMNRRGVVTHERPMYAYNRSIPRPNNPNNGRYYNPNGYNNTNRSMPGGNFNTGRRNDPSIPNGRTDRMGNNGNGMPGRPNNNGMGNRIPDMNNQGNRFPGNDRTRDNRLPGNNMGDRSNNNGGNPSRSYQPQQQNRTDNGMPPARQDRSMFDRQPRGGMDRSGGQPQMPPTQGNRMDRQPQMQQPSAPRTPQMERAPQMDRGGNNGRSYNPGGGGGRTYNPGGGGNSGGGGGRAPERSARASHGRGG